MTRVRSASLAVNLALSLAVTILSAGSLEGFVEARAALEQPGRP